MNNSATLNHIANYLFLFMLQLYAHLTPLEICATLIAALCHDLDHPGEGSLQM